MEEFGKKNESCKPIAMREDAEAKIPNWVISQILELKLKFLLEIWDQ